MRLTDADLGLLFRYERLERGWSQGEMCKRLTETGLTMNQTTWSRVEQGVRPITLVESQMVAEVFDVSMNALFGGRETFRTEAATRQLRLLREAVVQAQEALIAAERRIGEA